MTETSNIIIESIGTYLPDRIVSTTQLLEACKNKISFPIAELTGIESVRMAGDEEFSIDLAKKAITNCLFHSRHQASDVELLVCGNISRCDGVGFQYSFEPSTAVKLKRDMGLENALVFDISNACPGMFTAIKVVESFIKSGTIRCGMVVSGDYITHLTRTAQFEIEGLRDPRLACLTLGDAGAAVILEKAQNDKVGFHSLELYTVGCYSDLCIAKVTENEHGGAIMYTQPVRLAPAAVAHAIAHSVASVRKQGWTIDTIQHLIPHQTSRKTLADMSKGVNQVLGRKGWAEGVTIDNLSERGNTATTSHFVAMMDNIRKGRIKSSDNVVFSIAGSGLTVGTALFTFDDLPDRLRCSNSRPIHLNRGQARSANSFLPKRKTLGVRIQSVGTVPADWSGAKETIALAKTAVERCLARSPVDPADVGVLIFTGVYRTDFIYEPALAAMIVGALDLNARVESQTDKKTFAFDLCNGSLGFLNACHVATQMINAHDCEFALVVASEVEHNRSGCREKPRAIAETGSALLLGKSKNEPRGFGNFIFSYHCEHLGDFASHCAQERGTSFIQSNETGLLDEHYLECIPRTVQQLLQSEGVEVSQVRWILPPQRSTDFISMLGQRLNIERERFVDVVCSGKDLFTSAMPHALHHIIANKMVQPGDICLLIDVGAGIQVGCALYYF